MSDILNRDRRWFLQVAGGSVALAGWLRGAIARAEGAPKPKRLMLLHRPNGSCREAWTVGGKPASILDPFKDVWPYAVALDGVDVRPSNGATGGGHEAGLVTLMTGAKLGAQYRTNDDYRSTAESFDQTLVKKSAILGGARIKSLQLTAHFSQDGGNEIPNTAMSYSGAASPIYPTEKPIDAFNRVFGDTVLPGGGTPSNMEALEKARRKRQSVLDFVKKDLGRVRAQYPASFKTELDSHAAAIQEVEASLAGGAAAPMAGCAKPTIDSGLKAGGDSRNVEKVGAAHLKVVTAAFACDLTRVVTYMWGTGASAMGFGDLGTNNHHSTSHANQRNVLTAVDKWFSQKTAPFIQSLIDTADVGGGRLIDNTLVWYVNEVSEGHNHSFNNYPFLLFGGDGVGLKDRGRVVVAPSGSTTNDVWTSLAPSFGTELTSFGTKATGPIPGLFSKPTA